MPVLFFLNFFKLVSNYVFYIFFVETSSKIRNVSQTEDVLFSTSKLRSKALFNSSDPACVGKNVSRKSLEDTFDSGNTFIYLWILQLWQIFCLHKALKAIIWLAHNSCLCFMEINRETKCSSKTCSYDILNIYISGTFILIYITLVYC